MYSRSELDPSFGPYEVNICDTNLELNDGTLLSAKLWFPGGKRPFEPTIWSTYCKGVETLENEVTTVCVIYRVTQDKLSFSNQVECR